MQSAPPLQVSFKCLSHVVIAFFLGFGFNETLSRMRASQTPEQTLHVPDLLAMQKEISTYAASFFCSLTAIVMAVRPRKIKNTLLDIGQKQKITTTFRKSDVIFGLSLAYSMCNATPSQEEIVEIIQSYNITPSKAIIKSVMSIVGLRDDWNHSDLKNCSRVTLKKLHASAVSWDGLMGSVKQFATDVGLRVVGGSFDCDFTDESYDLRFFVCGYTNDAAYGLYNVELRLLAFVKDNEIDGFSEQTRLYLENEGMVKSLVQERDAQLLNYDEVLSLRQEFCLLSQEKGGIIHPKADVNGDVVMSRDCVKRQAGSVSDVHVIWLENTLNPKLGGLPFDCLFVLKLGSIAAIKKYYHLLDIDCADACVFRVESSRGMGFVAIQIKMNERTQRLLDQVANKSSIDFCDGSTHTAGFCLNGLPVEVDVPPRDSNYLF